MAVTRRVGVAQDPRFEAHRGPAGHPERPERLGAVAKAIEERGARLARIEPRPAGDEEILRVHGAEHLRLVEEAARRAPVRLDPDTYVCARSAEIARLAAGTTVEAARRVARGDLDAAFVAVRPPGHHAEAARAMGFCLLNHVAIAARALQREEGLGRVLVLDWDVHHGNGTQHVFESDPSVLYFSTHQFPYYPGSGDFDEAGTGPGEGATVNVPLPAGCGDDEYLGVMARAFAPVARSFRPDLVLVSCGFDAHAEDPLASMEVSGAGFRAVADVARAVADECCGGRIVLVLEGGYALSGLYEGTAGVLDALLAATGSAPGTGEPVRGSRLQRVLECVSGVHGHRHSGIGSA
jgi:acetoin utilization deacetylase AcuC-like enzyme